MRYQTVNLIIMEKECFIIMPISDHEDYEVGHFLRLYEYMIKPAVINAGFKPIRADEIKQTNYIVLDIVKRLLNADMAICDLSTTNPNVFYELGIRQSFNLPVCLIKDEKTNKVFDIQGFRYYEYNSNLRVDEVRKYVDEISESIKDTYQSGDGLNSLVDILGVKTPKIENKIELSQDSSFILKAIEDLSLKINDLNNQYSKSDNKKLSQLDLTKEEFDFTKFKEGDRVMHQKYGEGIIKTLDFKNDPQASVYFPDSGYKQFLLKFAKLYKLPE